MGEEDNFTVDPMNGRIVLLNRRVKKNKLVLSKVEIVLEEKEEQKIKRRQEEESEIDMISNFDFPNFDDKKETEEEKYMREIKAFQREMERMKEEWKER